MSKQLPPQPNLRHLKTQAKSLLKSLQNGDLEAVERIKLFLPRLSKSSEAETLKADVSLREVQHVIAREYGLKNWGLLQALVPEPKGGASGEYSPRLLELASRRFDEYTEDEFVELWVELSRQTHAGGLLSFMDLEVATPQISEGLRLAMGLTEPDLVWDILETRQGIMLYPREETRRRMTIEAVVSIHQGASPRILEHKLSCFFVDVVDGTEPPEDKDPLATSLNDLQIRLQEAPYCQMTFEQITGLFTEMALLRDGQGMDALAPLIEYADHPYLKRGLELMLSEQPGQEVIDTLEELMDAELQEIKIRYKMVLLGMKALQTRKTPEEMTSFLREQTADLRSPQ